MNDLSPETLQDMAGMRREATKDLTDLVFLLNIASEKLNTLGEKYSFLGVEFSDLNTAIRIAKNCAEQSQNYHDAEAVQIDIKTKTALEKLQATGPLLKEQEK